MQSQQSWAVLSWYARGRVVRTWKQVHVTSSRWRRLLSSPIPVDALIHSNLLQPQPREIIPDQLKTRRVKWQDE